MAAWLFVLNFKPISTYRQQIAWHFGFIVGLFGPFVAIEALFERPGKRPKVGFFSISAVIVGIVLIGLLVFTKYMNQL